MSDAYPGSDPASPVPATASNRPRGVPAPSLLIALAALALAGYAAWTNWQRARGDAAAQGSGRSPAALDARISTLEDALTAIRQERGGLRQRLGDAEAVNRSLREEVLGLSERARNLEDAVANLSEKRLSGHDAMLLDEAEMLLRMAKERYALFQDAEGALAAYDLADQALSGVEDPAFAGVRQSLAAERDALAAVKPTARAADLAALSRLRDALPALPLKPLDMPRTAGGGDGAFARVGRALAGLVRISRDDGAPLASADARFARELAALDLAEAQAALLAYDRGAYAAASKRTLATLDLQFDGRAEAVQQARAELARLAAEPAATATAPQLGAALKELHDLRAVHALKPARAGGKAAP